MQNQPQHSRQHDSETIEPQAPHPFQNREIETDIQKRLIHHCICIDGIEVFFPHKPYPVQEEYMRSVIAALNTRSNALLQSPTGTGKTLAMLCAALGWLRHRRRAADASTSESGFNRILYCSRTHSQLKQIVRELKSTAYKAKLCILASRDQYCLKKEFSHLKDLELNGACKKSIEDKSCQFYNFSLKDKRQVPRIFDDVLDIEDLQARASLASSASCGKFCPYYYSREVKDEADIVILPYSFLLQQNRFVNFQVILKDAIIIFDEAHNVPSSAEEGTSYKVDQSLITESLKELEYLESHLTNQMRTKPNDIKDAQTLVLAFGNLLNYFEKSTSLERQKDGSIGKLTRMAYFFEMIQQIQCQLHVSKKSLKQAEANKKWHKEVEGQMKFDYKVMLADLKNAKDKKKSNATSKGDGSQPTLFNFSFKKTVTPAPLLSQVKFSFQEKSAVAADEAAAAAGAAETTPAEELEDDQLELDPSQTVSFDKISKVCKKLSNIISDMQTMKCQNIDFFAGFIAGICAMHDQDAANSRSVSMSSSTVNPSQKVSDFYRFYFQKGVKANEKSTINLWCLDPSLAFQNIVKQQPHSILLTSGTLDPMNSWDTELRIPFAVKLATAHVIDSKLSVLASIVNASRTGVSLNFSYSNRQNGNQTYEELGEFLIDLSSKVPNGMLVCFSSGSVLRLTQEAWSSSKNRIITRLNDLKELFFEPPNNLELTQVMKKYCQFAVDDSKGAILFCVCRGKISEGIDFTDKLARAVVVVGVPFPPSTDTWVCTKMEYLESALTAVKNEKQEANSNLIRSLPPISGKEWYFLSTVRAMNQAIGRVIRHKDDFGAVLLCDTRFGQQQFNDHISKWVKQSLTSYESYSCLIESIASFFEAKKEAVTSLDKLLTLGSSSHTKPSSEASLEPAYPHTNAPYMLSNIPFNANSKRHPDLSYTSKFASKHQFTAIFAENQKINNINPNQHARNTEELNSISNSINCNPEQSDRNSVVPKRKIQISMQQLQKSSLQIDTSEQEQSKKENNSSNFSFEHSQSAESSSSRSFSKVPPTNNHNYSENPFGDWGSSYNEIAARTINRRASQVTAMTSSTAMANSMNESYRSIKTNNNNIMKPGKNEQNEEKPGSYLSEIFREFSDYQDQSDEDSMSNNNKKKVVVQRRLKSLTYLSNDNKLNACTPLSFADQLKLNMKNSTPPGQKSSISPSTPNSSNQKPTPRNFDKVMLSNTAKGLGSFHAGDIVSIKPKENEKNFTKDTNQTNQISPQEDSKEQLEKKVWSGPVELQEDFDDTLMCPICYDTPKNIHINTNCSHKACFECWKKWLSQQLTCPMCRTRCRLAYLEPCQ